MLEDLGPMFVKMGQILANRSEILPQEYCDELRRLRSNVEPVPFAVVHDCLVAEYGRPLTRSSPISTAGPWAVPRSHRCIVPRS